MEWELCIGGDGGDIRNFLHRIKGTVDKGWPDDMIGIEAAQQHKRKRLPKKSPLPETMIESEDHAMDQNNGLEQKFFREEIITTLTMDL